MAKREPKGPVIPGLVVYYVSAELFPMPSFTVRRVVVVRELDDKRWEVEIDGETNKDGLEVDPAFVRDTYYLSRCERTRQDAIEWERQRIEEMERSATEDLKLCRQLTELARRAV